ncbi:uncharacterized protein LOC124326609 [Daphnia pulicaria]|uniref:uncharacterized protein LOC124326609 n=1 Tax=Daphnia pulicaria TaxID=35523 RepID=UPI001EECEFBE|nr:uncharacterized protein LOC124326609 [Daphnia pulicaria]
MRTLTVGKRLTTPVILLVLAGLGLSQGRPPHQQNQPMMMRFCGIELTLVIDEVCTAHKSPDFVDHLILNRPSSNNESTGNGRTELDDKKSDSLLRQCCVIGCTEDDFSTFCRIDRNQIREVAIRLRSEDVDADWLYEFLPRYGAIHAPE